MHSGWQHLFSCSEIHQRQKQRGLEKCLGQLWEPPTQQSSVSSHHLSHYRKEEQDSWVITWIYKLLSVKVSVTPFPPGLNELLTSTRTWVPLQLFNWFRSGDSFFLKSNRKINYEIVMGLFYQYYFILFLRLCWFNFNTICFN